VGEVCPLSEILPPAPLARPGFPIRGHYSVLAIAEVCVNLDAYLTRAQARQVIGVSLATVGNWRARGWFGQDGHRQQLRTKSGPRGTLLYRLGDLLEAERDTRMSPRSPRYARPGTPAASGSVAGGQTT
jgi:hypothetical protein